MKKFIGMLIVLAVVFIAVVVVGAKFYAEPELKNLIESKGSEILGSPVTVGSVKIEFWPPIYISVQGLSFELGSNQAKKALTTSVLIPVLRISSDLKSLIPLRLAVSVGVDKPHIRINLPKDAAVDQVQPTPVKTEASGKPSVLPFAVNLLVQEAGIELVRGSDSIELTKFNLSSEVLSLVEPIKITAQSEINVNWPPLIFNVPMNLVTNLEVTEDNCKVSMSQLNLGGLVVTFQGSAGFKTEDQKWEFHLDVPNLKSLPSISSFLPEGQWAGKLLSNVNIYRQKDQDWKANGDFKAQSILANLNYKKTDRSATGNFAADADLIFTYDKTVSFSNIRLAAQLSELNLAYSNLFAKPNGVPLSFAIEANEANQILDIKKADFVLARFSASVLGTINSVKGQPSNLKISVPRNSLSGFEKFFPSLSEMPLKGFLELQASVNGDLQNPESLNLSINPLVLENVSGKVHWKSADQSLSIDGPVDVNAKAVIVAIGQNLASANIDAQADLTNLAIEAGQNFKKKSNQILKLKVKAKQKSNSIEISQSVVTTPAGNILLKGNVREPQSPKVNINVKALQIDLRQLSILGPILAQWKLGGLAHLDFNLAGNYDFKKGIQESLLSLNGSAGADIPEFSYHSAAATQAANESETSPEKAPPQAILPDWPIVKSLGLAMDLKLGKLAFNDLNVSGIKWQGKIAQGILTGNGQIQEIFGGKVDIAKSRISLTDVAPSTEISTQIQNLDLAKALTWATPQWKDLVRGLATGTAEMNIAHPSRKDFVEKTSVKGNLKIANGYLSTLPFDQFINKKLATIPMVGNKASVNTKGTAMNMDSIFDFSVGQLKLKSLHLLTPEKNELQASGWVKTDKTMDLRGQVFLADAPVQGSVREANSDSTGRLVLPVHFSGGVFSPELGITDETIKQIMIKTANLEADKAKSRAKNEIQKQIDLQKNKLQDEAKQHLKGILGQ